MKIAIQGQIGSFHHLAAQKYYGTDSTVIPCTSFREVFEILASGHAEQAVVALENSSYGSLNDTYDYLLDFNPKIIGEVYLHIAFNIYGMHNAELTTITDIYSQAPALMECREYLRKELPWARQHEVYDTAAAAEFVAKEQDKTKAAIASEAAGELHKLTPLAEHIDDNTHNYTRFAVISMTEKTIIGANKTSIILHTAHTPGALYEILGIFNDHAVNLTKLESRPIAGRDWHYVFYLDFECEESEVREQLLSRLHAHDHEISILGSYKAGVMPSL